MGGRAPGLHLPAATCFAAWRDRSSKGRRALGELLPVTDVGPGGVLGRGGREERHGTPGTLAHLHQCGAHASRPRRRETAILSVAAGQRRGKAFGEQAGRPRLPTMHLVPRAGAGRPDVLPRTGILTCKTCSECSILAGTAYREPQPLPAQSPHARFDLTDWLPIDPRCPFRKSLGSPAMAKWPS